MTPILYFTQAERSREPRRDALFSYGRKKWILLIKDFRRKDREKCAFVQ